MTINSQFPARLSDTGTEKDELSLPIISNEDANSYVPPIVQYNPPNPPPSPGIRDLSPATLPFEKPIVPKNDPHPAVPEVDMDDADFLEDGIADREMDMDVDNDDSADPRAETPKDTILDPADDIPEDDIPEDEVAEDDVAEDEISEDEISEDEISEDEILNTKGKVSITRYLLYTIHMPDFTFKPV